MVSGSGEKLQRSDPSYSLKNITLERGFFMLQRGYAHKGLVACHFSTL